LIGTTTGFEDPSGGDDSANVTCLDNQGRLNKEGQGQLALSHPNNVDVYVTDFNSNELP